MQYLAGRKYKTSLLRKGGEKYLQEGGKVWKKFNIGIVKGNNFASSVLVSSAKKKKKELSGWMGGSSWLNSLLQIVLDLQSHQAQRFCC